ncbi:MAG: hypothetical protein ACR2MS_01060 [Weeksellaceae bacterium]
MKNILSFVFLVLICVSTLAQEQFIFKVKIKPNKTYTKQLYTVGRNEITFVSDKEAINDSTMQSPIIIESDSQMTVIEKTQALDENGEIPTTLVYDKMLTKKTINGDEDSTKNNPYAGMKIMGKYDKNFKLKIEQITGDYITQQMKDLLINTLEQIQQGIEFPERPLRVGDSFDNQIPLTIPIEGMSPIVIYNHMKLLLTSIKDNMAYFKNEYNISFQMQEEDLSIEASGSGTGTSVYDIEENYLIKNTSQIPMNFIVNVSEGKTIKMEIVTNSQHHTTIE